MSPSTLCVWTDIKLDDCSFKLKAEPEETPVRGNAMASGDDAADKKLEDEIIADLESGNDWAWCSVKVVAYVEFDFVGTAYLGCCSYKSAQDFMAPGGYWESMKAEALADLNKQGRELCEKLNKRAAK